MTLTMNDYQQKTEATAIYPSEYGILYCSMKLSGEAGEVTEKVAKLIRDGNWQPHDNVLTEAEQEMVCKELGDVLWYVARLAKESGLSLEQVAQVNLNKLWDRQERGVLGGSGDER